MSEKYTDNYMTDESGQRWVKLEYAQEIQDQCEKAQEEIRINGDN